MPATKLTKMMLNLVDQHEHLMMTQSKQPTTLGEGFLKQVLLKQ
jgi:hypothetical protein